MFTKNLDKLTEQDLKTLVDNAVPEGKTIEYKQQLPNDSDNDKKEFLADVSSFANASGGMIIYGVVQNSSTGNPEKLEGVEVLNTDKEIARLDSIIRTSIEPRIPSFTIKNIILQNSRTAIVIHISKSWISPHRVTFKGHDKFYSRSSNGKYPLDVEELRIAFNLSETITERIKTFKSERLASILSNDTPVIIKDTARMVLHLIPYNAFVPGQKYEFDERRELNTKLEPIYTSGWNARYNFDGFLTYSGNQENKYRSYTQLFRNGVIEAVDSYLLQPRSGDQKTIPSIAYEECLISSLNRYLKLLKSFEVEMPIILFLTFVGVKDYTMALSSRFSAFDQLAIDKDILQLPEIIIDAYDKKPEEVLRPCFDAVWNACGLPKSYNYDDNGTWVKR